VTAARAAQTSVLELRYEDLAADPEAVAGRLASYLGGPEDELAAALGRAHGSSVGRYRGALDEQQLVDVLDEAGELLRELGYLVD
jgi:hypothetical protein